jgi:hypothetical protein
MIVTLDAKRRLTVPASLAPASPGDYLDASFAAARRHRLTIATANDRDFRHPGLKVI